MEEKERFEWNSRFDEAIKDNQTGDIVNAVEVLNKQDKQIKRLRQEKQQLKQQLHDLPKKIVCEISEAIERLSWRKRIYTNWEFDKEQLYKDLDTILKKFGGKNEINND